MPFFPTPNRDDGYDITDYYTVDDRLGTLGDFVEFVSVAQHRGVRVIIDLVVNHTSREHPWFQAARRDPKSPHRQWYVWREEIPEDGPQGLIFPGAQKSNWAWDEEAHLYYLHRFYKHQPDLNVAHPEVRDEIRKIMGFWLQLGVSGFRVDAVPFLLETDGIDHRMDVAPHDWLYQLRAFLGRRSGDGLLMGEVNLEPQDVRRYYGGDKGGELQMCLNFNLNQAMALSLARQDAGPLVHSLRTLPHLPYDSQWANFVRNHDEWSLDKLTDAERQEVFKAFGPKKEMQIFNRGLRRRLPTMLNGDGARLRMAYALTMALPGAPVLFYGEEIGMAENLEIEGRGSVRSPMQWSDAPGAGFSEAPPDELCRPIVKGKRWGPAGINVAQQRHDASSLLNWMERLIRCRRETPEIGLGRWSMIGIDESSVLAIRYDWDGRILLVVQNLGNKPEQVQIQIDEASEWKGLEEVFGQGSFALERDGAITIELDAYGSRWLRAHRSGRVGF